MTMRLLLILAIFQVAFSQSECFQAGGSLKAQSSSIASTNAKTSANFEIGFYDLNRQNNLIARYLCFTVPLKQTYPAGYQSILSIPTITSYQDPQGVDYGIVPRNLATSISGVLIISETATWKSLKLYYMASSMPSMLIGTVSSTIPKWNPKTGFFKGPISFRMTSKWLGSLKEIYALISIGGIKTLEINPSIIINTSTYSPRKSLLTFSVTVNSKLPIDVVYFNYIIITLDSTLVLYTVSAKDDTGDLPVFQGIVNFSPTKSLINKQFFNSNDITVVGYAIMSIGSRVSSRRVQQIVKGSARNLTVPPEIDRCLSMVQCVSLDGLFQSSQTQNNVLTSSCTICPLNSIYNATNNQCTCINKMTFSGNICACSDGFYKDGYACIPCQVNDIWNQQKCGCHSSSIRQQDGTCVCKLNENWNGTKCQCLVGTYRNAFNNCIKCSQYQVLDFQKQKCVCMPNYPYREPSGKCIKCSKYATFSNETCKCMKGYSGDGSTCRKP